VVIATPSQVVDFAGTPKIIEDVSGSLGIADPSWS
jgi:hypothetical protein